MTTIEFLEQKKSEIRPGCKGAPARREKYEKLSNLHEIREDRLKRNLRHRSESRYRDPKFDGAFGGNPQKKEDSKQRKITSRIMTKINALPDWRLAKIVSRVQLKDSIYGIRNRERYVISVDLTRYIRGWIAAQSEDRLYRDGYVEYRESTEWDKYGSRSYPRTVDRRIEYVTRSKSELIKYLESGERAETAIDSIIPDRSNRRKQSKIEAKKAEIEKFNIGIETPISVYKTVAKVGEKFLSIFDGKTEYKIGQITSDKKIKKGEICTSGGIFVHRTIELAKKQKFPDSSELIDLVSSRVILQGDAWGKFNEDGKIAVENFKPISIIQ